MRKYLPIYLYGAIVVLEGIFLLFSKYSTFNTIILTLGISLTLGAVFAFMAAFSRRNKHIQFSYHQMHALAMLVYGNAILLFCNTLEMLVYFTAFLFIFYFFSEIIFCNRLFNSGQKALYKIVIVRLLLGLVVGVGTVIALNFSMFTLEVFGLLFMMIGINIMLYVPVMKAKELGEAQYASKEAYI